MSRFPNHSTLVRVCVLLALMVSTILSGPRVVLGQSAWYEGFEQKDPSWERLGADVRYNIREQQRTPLIRHTGERSEWISLVGDTGTHVYIGHDVGNPRIIDELVPTIQIRSDRPGIQLLAELTLPRSRNPQTGKSLTTLVRGTSYSKVGKWEQLRIDDLPRLLSRQTHILRNEFGSDVDPREAYISRIVLNVYGGPGATNVWIDDLDIAGYVQAPASSTASPEPTASASSTPWKSANLPAVDDESQRRVRLDRSILLVDERPFFVRAVRWRGEPLTALKVLGFNTVWLDRFPSPELLAMADQAGVWLISPPPPLPLPPPAGGTNQTILGPEYRSVLAWDLGTGLGEQQKDSVRQLADGIRAADSRFRRPIIARPESGLRAYSRIADILVIGRPALGSSLELADYAQWLRLRPQLARPGTPFWVVVPTGPEPALRAQWDAMAPGGSPTTGFSAEQLRLITYLSCVSGTRGLLFESHTPLDATAPAAETRRVILELLNLELTLSEPWFAGGNFAVMAYSKNPKLKDLQATVLRTDRAQLVIPIWLAPGTGQVPSLPSQRTISVNVPGVPEADEAYELVPGRLRRCHHSLGTPGTNVTLDQFALTGQILFTQDPKLFTNRSRQARLIGPRAAELQRRLVELRMKQFEQFLVPLTMVAPNTPQLKALEADVPALRRAAQESLQKCTRAIAAENYADAYLNAEEAMRPFRLLEHEHWLAASQSVTGLAASPLLASFSTLPGHWSLLRETAQRPPGANLLPGGNFENLQIWLNAGWDHFQHPVPGVIAQANLAPEAAHSGTLGLRLAVAPKALDQVPQLVESPPVWITSAPVNLEIRSLVVIRGWVRIPEPIQGSADGLLVIDSLTGQHLAERIHANDQWQEFVLYRACPQSGPVRLTFALSGMGTAYVDDVSIQILTTASAPVASATPYPATTAR